jgi:hypothetical protein
MSRQGRPRDLCRRGTIHLNIERLVLRGVAPGEVGRLTAALQSELTWLAAQPGQVFAAANTEWIAPIQFTTGTSGV